MMGGVERICKISRSYNSSLQIFCPHYYDFVTNVFKYFSFLPRVAQLSCMNIELADIMDLASLGGLTHYCIMAV